MSIEFTKIPYIIPAAATGTWYLHKVLPSTTADGYVRNYNDTSWANARNATTGNSYSDSATWNLEGMAAIEDPFKKPRYFVYRSFLYFDMSNLLTGLPETGLTIISGTLRIHSYDYNTNVPPNQYADSDVSAFQGTQADALSTADFDAFGATEFGRTTWKKYNVNYIDLNQAGIDYLNSVGVGTAKICLREYDHDVLDVAPPDDTYFRNSLMFKDVETYDFYSSTYHREYVPFLYLYFKHDWEYAEPAEDTGQNYAYALDGPTLFKGTDWNHDLRIAHLRASSTTWSGAHDATTATSTTYGDNSFSTIQVRTGSDPGGAPDYDPYIQRAFLAFDMAEITREYKDDAGSAITGADIRIRSRGGLATSGTMKVDAFQGTWDYTLTAADYDSFTGNSLLTVPVSWAVLDDYMTLTLNQDGIDYLNDNHGKIVYFCLREYEQDVLNVSPGVLDFVHRGYFYGTGQGSDATYDPRLRLSYDTTD